MRSRSAAIGCASSVLLAFALNHSTALAAWPHDPNLGLALTRAAFSQTNPRAVSDGAGGAVVVWADYRSGTSNGDIYAQRVTASGQIAAGWPADGVAISTATGDQFMPAIASDGAGGAIIAWASNQLGGYDIFAQRVRADGSLPWAANGVPLCSVGLDQDDPLVIADDAGGAVVAWRDLRLGGFPELYAVRVTSTGTVASGWPANGTAVRSAAAAGTFASPGMVPDGAGGAIFAWTDTRAFANNDIYAQRLTGTGAVATNWVVNGVLLCSEASLQLNPVIARDGQGGAVVAWNDYRNMGTSGIDIYAQRVAPGADMAWTFNGAPVCTATGAQGVTAIAPDGLGGVFIAWNDARTGSGEVYAQRVTAAGANASGWTANGVNVAVAAGTRGSAQVNPDGLGGAVLCWIDQRNGTEDIYAQRLAASGSPALGWSSTGSAVSSAVFGQTSVQVVGDGNSGAVAVWQDFRSGGLGTDIFAQRIERLGYLGSPEPIIASVRDVPNDQGGRVKLSWYSSYLDDAPYGFVDAYWIYRSVAPNLVTQWLANGARLVTDPADGIAAEGRAILATTSGSTDYFWEYLASVSALHYFTQYSYVATTLTDSIGNYNPPTAFMVQAQKLYSGYWWSSLPDSGYSTDNVAPAPPAPFIGSFAGGATALHWGANVEPDLWGYRLYRGSSAGFTPGPGNRIAEQPDTGFVDVVGPMGSYYKLSALDIHGNESAYALLTPQLISGVGGEVPEHVALDPPYPNPVHDSATLSFALPRAVHVELAIYDARGRQVRLLLRGMLPAGGHAATWDGRDSQGRRAASGLYLVRLKAGERVLSARMVATF